MIVVSPARGSGITTTTGSVNLEDAYYTTVDDDAKISFSPAGTVTGETTATSGPLSYTWLNTGSASDYEIYCQPVSGSVNGTKVNSWQPLNSDLSWQRGSTGVAVISLSIRDKTTRLVLKTATVTLEYV